ncbi:MAG TPA: class I SAM-dependent methyltransferase [Candidatus Eisenbacteria bacterium]|nr:class I SAM-dependent methyltransferase [Candidatus Eisenbacteria bacterium]
MAEPDHYGRAGLAGSILAALRDVHGERERFAPTELAGIDQLHTWGAAGTARLAELAGIGANDRVLDLGGGLGGAARQLAAERGCHVTVVDLSPWLCEAAELLNRLTGLEARVAIRRGDVLAPPVPAGAYDVVWLQHVAMHVADRGRLFGAARRALVPGGRLALWEVTAGPAGPPHLPAPWGDSPGSLTSAGELRAAALAAGFQEVAWRDMTQELAARMRAVRAMGGARSEPGPELVVADMAARQENHLRSLIEGRAGLVLAVLCLAAEVSPKT